MNTSETVAGCTGDDRLDRIFQALSDRTRRAIVGRLREGSATVKELAAPFDMTLPAIGKHLRVLEKAGIMTRVVRGRNHICSLSPEALAEADRWVGSYRTFWEQNLASLAAEVEMDDDA